MGAHARGMVGGWEAWGVFERAQGATGVDSMHGCLGACKGQSVDQKVIAPYRPEPPC